MKSNWRVYTLAISILVFLALFNLSVAQKETLLKNGTLVLLKMSPVDPRSPLQGDYMSLNYEATDRISLDSLPHRGYCILKVVDLNVYGKVRFQEKLDPLGKDEIAIQYTTDRHRMHLGSSTFFFQEGKAALYEKATYAGLRVDQRGNSVLIGLYDQHQRLIR